MSVIMNEHNTIILLKSILCCTESKMYDEAIALAIDAVEKQIPKIPVYLDFDEDDAGEYLLATKALCPRCGYEFEFGTWNDEDSHHCVCGQAIDWDSDGNI